MPKNTNLTYLERTTQKYLFICYFDKKINKLCFGHVLFIKKNEDKLHIVEIQC